MTATFLEGERVTLRPIERDDIEFLQRATCEPELRVPLGFSQPANRSQVESHVEGQIESDESIDLLIWAEGDRIGSLRINMLDRTRPMLSYWVAPEHHGEGYATEATTLAIEYFFENFENRGLHAFAFAYNEASRGLLEKLGFVEEGRLRDDQFRNGEYVDSVHYGLLREEWTGKE